MQFKTVRFLRWAKRERVTTNECGWLRGIWFSCNIQDHIYVVGEALYYYVGNYVVSMSHSTNNCRYNYAMGNGISGEGGNANMPLFVTNICILP